MVQDALRTIGYCYHLVTFYQITKQLSRELFGQSSFDEFVKSRKQEKMSC